MLIRRLGLAVLLLVTAGLRAQTLTGTAVADPAVPTVISPSVSGSDYFVLNKDLTLSGRFRAQTTQTITCPAPAGFAAASATPRSLINDATNAYFTAQSSTSNVAASTQSPGYPCTSAAALSLAGGTPTQTFATNDQRHGRYHVLESFGGNGPDTLTVIANLNTNQSSTPTLTKSNSVSLDTNGTYTSMTTDLYSDYGLTAITQLRTATSPGGLWVYSPGIQTMFKILGPGGTPLPAIGAFIIPATANDNGDLLVLVNQDNVTATNQANPPVVLNPFTIIDLGQLNRAFSAVVSQGTTITLPSVSSIPATTPFYGMLGAVYSPVFHLLYAVTAGATSQNVIRYDPTNPNSPAETVVADVSNIPFTFGTYPQLALNAAAGTMEILSAGTLYHVPVAGKNNVATAVTGTPFPDSNFKPTFIASNPLLGETYIASASQVDILTLSGSSTKRAVLELYGTDNAVVNQSYTLYANGINPSSDSDLTFAAVTFTATPAGGGTPITLGTGQFYQFTGAPGSSTSVKFPATGIYTVVATVAATANYPAVTSLPITVGVGTTAIAPVYPTTARLIVPQTSTSTTVTASLYLLGSTYAPSGRIIITDATGTQVGRYNFTGGATSYPVSVTLTLPNGASTLTAAYNGDTQNQPSTSPAVNITVGTVAKVTPTMAITLPTTSAPSATVTGTLAFTSTSTSAPTGNITVTQNSTAGVSTVIATIPASQAAAAGGKTFTFTAPSAADTYNIYASYDGDTNFNLAFSPTYKLTVAAAAAIVTNINLSAPSTPIAGTPFTANITLTPKTTSSTAPTGNVTLTSTSGAGTVTTLATITAAQATASGGYPAQVTLTSAGTYTLTASYVGDTNYAASTNTVTVTVPGPVGTNLNLSAPANATQGVAFTALLTLTPKTTANATPTGNVVLTANNSGTITTLATVPAAQAFASGGFPAQVTITGTGQNTLTATYAGDANFTASTGSVSVYVTLPVPIAVNLGLSSASTVTGGVAFPVTLTFTPKTTSTTVPTGNIVFTATPAGATQPSLTLNVLASAAFASGGKAVQLTLDNVGPYTLAVNYLGDTTYANAFGQIGITVAAPPKTTPALSLSLGPAASAPGDKLTGQVTYTFAGTVVPTGNFILNLKAANGTVTPTYSIPASVVRTSLISVFQITSPDAGTYSAYLTYDGDASFSPTTSNAIALTVTGNNLVQTGIALSVPSIYPPGSVPIAIQLFPRTPTTKVPTGLIDITATYGTGGTPQKLGSVLASDALVAGGTPYNAALLATGNWTILASYPGDSNFSPSSQTNTLTTQKTDLKVTISGPAATTTGIPVTFQTAITGYAVAPISGLIVTSAAGTLVGPQGATIGTNGSVVLTFTNPGTYILTATFAGDYGNNPATGTFTTVVTGGLVAGYSMKLDNASDATVPVELNQTGYADVPFTLTAINGFNGTVTLSATFVETDGRISQVHADDSNLYLVDNNENRLTPTGAGIHSYLSIPTSGGLHLRVRLRGAAYTGASLRSPFRKKLESPTGVAFAALFLGLGCFGWRKRRTLSPALLKGLVVLLVIVSSGAILAGCGADGATFTVTLTGVPGGVNGTANGATTQTISFPVHYTSSDF